MLSAQKYALIYKCANVTCKCFPFGLNSISLPYYSCIFCVIQHVLIACLIHFKQNILILRPEPTVMKILYVLFTLLLCAELSRAQNNAGLIKPLPSERQKQLQALHKKNVKTADFYSIDVTVLNNIMVAKPATLTLRITESGKEYNLVMARVNPLAAGYKLMNSRGDSLQQTDMLHYRGYIGGDMQSLVAFSFSREDVSGIVMNIQGNFVFGKLRGQTEDTYVFYNDHNLNIKNNYHCGTEDIKEYVKRPGIELREGSAGGCKKVGIYLEADYTTYSSFGSISATENFMLAMFNVVAAVYQADGMELELTGLKVWNTVSPYDVYDTFYGSITSFANNLQDNFAGNLAHLYATAQSAGGVGFLDVLCTSYDFVTQSGPYSFGDGAAFFENLPVYSWTINLVTHELGHNLGSRHTHYCGWELSPGVYGAIDSCTTVEEDDFGNSCYLGPSIPITGTIMSYCHLQGNVDFNLGFGPLPSALMRQNIANANCVATSSNVSPPEVSNYGPYCLGDTIVLRATGLANRTITWLGPDGFNSHDSVTTLIADNISKKGVYTAVLSNDTCDASATTYVEVFNPPPVSAVNIFSGNILQPVLNSQAFTYQWYRNGLLIAGATAVTYQADSSGSYTVEIRNAAGCKTMSLAYVLVPTGIYDLPAQPFNVYMLPTGNEIGVQLFDKNCQEDIVYKLTDVAGKLIDSRKLSCNQTHIIAADNLPAGMYFAQVGHTGSNPVIFKLFKN